MQPKSQWSEIVPDNVHTLQGSQAVPGELRYSAKEGHWGWEVFSSCPTFCAAAIHFFPPLCFLLGLDVF